MSWSYVLVVNGVVDYTEDLHSRGNAVVSMKVIVLGKAGIGKTCLSRRYTHDQFSSSVATTVGAAFGAKRLLIDDKHIVMGIWDTAGSERYEAMSRIYYRGAKAAIVCYDLTDITSFNKVRFWVDELKKNEEDCKIYLCGTKKDLIDASPKDRQVDIHDARDFADEFQAEVFETSSKTGENINQLFTKIAQDYKRNKYPPPVSESGIHLDDGGGQRKRCRC